LHRLDHERAAYVMALSIWRGFCFLVDYLKMEPIELYQNARLCGMMSAIGQSPFFWGGGA